MKPIEDPLADPDYIAWLQDRIDEARRAQDAEMEAKRIQKGLDWLEQTEKNGEPPC